MPNKNMLKEIRSIVISVAIFLVLHFALTAGSNYFARTADNFSTWLLWINITAYFLYVLVGFVAGALSKRHFLLVGAITGICSAAAAILIFGVAGNDIFGILAMVVNGAVFGGIGGAISLYVIRKSLNVL